MTTSARYRRTRLATITSSVALLGVLTPFVWDASATPPTATAATGTQSSSTFGAAAAGEQSGPWAEDGYRPRPGQWQPYVLAPTGRTVKPVSVLSADPRGGEIKGDPKAALGGGDSPVRLVSKGDRTLSPLLTLDFGKNVGGTVKVRVSGASETPPELHVCFSESQLYAAFDPEDNNGQAAHAPGCDTANIWNGYPGVPYTYDNDSHTLEIDPANLPATLTDTQLRGAFRYATLFLDGEGWVDVDGVSLDFGAVPKAENPAAYDGWFLSSDNELNKIWYAGAYTVQLNTWMSNTAKKWPYEPGEADHADAQVPHADPNEAVIFDGGKRDRIVWQGDLAVQAPVAYLSTDDVPAVENSLSSLAAQQLPDGYVPAASLVGQHNQNELRVYGEYVTWFIHNLYTHWLYTGDQEYVERWWPQLTRATAWLEGVRADDPKGLISFQEVGSCGHYGYSDCGHETYINALYARNLEQMARLARVTGHKADASGYASRAAAVKDAINEELWDEETGAYRLSREIPGAYPQDANATAVLTGVADDEQATRALDYLRRNSWGPYGAYTVSPSTPNASIRPFYEPLPSWFETSARLEATDSSGEVDNSALDLMRTFWGHQLSQDPGSTFWEKADPSGNPGIKQFTSLAHGWASGPTVALTTQVLGVQPTGPGYSSYAIVPNTGDLTWAQGEVPTPHGNISASWRAGRDGVVLKATAPSGTVGRLAVPTRGERVSVTLDGRTVWDGSRAVGGARASSDGEFVYVDAVGAGHHVLRSHLG
ncbi:alpha-L-rhamnosidase-related protein [Wenjunlia vitaminophila]|uniref:alpha-L-rhamnosidase-related protein n=1 Tax=Wenjunlia vitaminophila TaxID=76728 RepID=UPI00039EEFC9|nr:alpha-L-rhamnosidase C-terminal domain-containing protein [Wenjunlia vitaminophila]